MKILVACEYSGTVRDAFIARGHDAISCDLLPTESLGPHYQGNVMDIIGDGYDMLIGHPPCNFISFAGTSSWNLPGRSFKRLEALHFFAQLWECGITKICLENPKSCASPVIAKYSQEIQPYYFGDAEMKTTWLWLKGLPLLHHTAGPDLFSNSKHEIPKIHSTDSSGKKRYFTDGKTRDPKARAHFWKGIANAMATQWG
jgi:hypothetical protein